MLIKSLLLILFLVISNVSYGALVEGTNCGFVITAPTADPEGTALTSSDFTSRACKFTAPAGAITVTEIGFWVNNATEEANFEVGIYSDNGNGATSLPLTLQAGVSRTNAKGTTAGWKTASVNISITAGTIYWIAYQLDNTATTTQTDQATGGARRSFISGSSTLPTTWVSDGAVDNIQAFYAVYTTGAVSILQPIINIF